MKGLRLLAALLALVMFGVGCDPAAVDAPATTIDDRDVQIAELRAEFDDLATSQAKADEQLRVALEAARAIDRSVVRFLDPATLYDQGEEWDQVQSVVDAAEFTGLRQPYIDVALAADQARLTLSRAQDRVGEDVDQAYLAAQDDVLVAIRGYAEQADRIAQLLERHAEIYLRFATQNQSFTERRFFFRSAEEAADAYATEIDSFVGDLATAQQQVADEVQPWQDAAVIVNDATLIARRIYESRGES